MVWGVKGQLSCFQWEQAPRGTLEPSPLWQDQCEAETLPEVAPFIGFYSICSPGSPTPSLVLLGALDKSLAHES